MGEVRENAKEKGTTTIRLTPDAKDIIRRLSGKFGISQTAVIEIAIRVLAEKEHLIWESVRKD